MISIIIPIYNVESYIKECLSSVVAQTTTEALECILVDDCGNDSSIAIAETFIKEYTGNIEFRLLHHDCNRGLSSARNTGIKAARGEYIYFLDSDDEILPSCIDMMAERLKQYGKVDIVQGFIFEDRQHTSRICPYNIPEYTKNRKTIKTFLLKYEGDIIPAQNRLLKTDFIRKHELYFKEGIIHEDNHWAFFLAKYVKTMCTCKERAYHHRYNPSSITGNVNTVKERQAYLNIVTDLCQHIDNFLPGKQKEYILCNLITAINANYFTSKQEETEMINRLSAVCNPLEKMMMYVYFNTKNNSIRQKAFRVLSLLFQI